MSPKQCRDCPARFEAKRENQYRCPKCQKLSLTVRKRRGPCQISRNCVVCQQAFLASQKTNVVCDGSECRAEHKRRLANSLNRGRPTVGTDPRICVVCENEFRGHRNALCCSRKCRLLRHRELARRRLNIGIYHCVSCGKAIPPELDGKEYRYTCSQECRKRALLAKDRRTREKHPEIAQKYIKKHRERIATDPEFAEYCREQDRRYRMKRNAAKFEREVAVLENELRKRAEQ
jgi:predicted nucleic acid-binding Zn ribbon protein